ncbi:acetyl-CoA acyltransferase [Brevibacterium paucivorans]|uniref:Acetyl-CoA C-acyltransferase n=1 Tax=Brevibacterium paucivorans TaxID=170994 RepID=A0A2N6VLY3_9MICO|nr:MULTISPECIES: thiolase family protein [Brevibacterium]MBM7816027.1 acetyl-CoA acyltransferase [Brevibacterium paucivorans]MCG7297721.1 thiolase family protein [Brevibacterium sp. ACRRH]PMD05162.1 acetyl-CoA C-acyltransferase [Brevibacterium paucivorans]
MNDAVIVAARRTPTGKREGMLSGIHPADLSALVIEDIVSTTGIDPNLIDDVIWGCVTQAGEQTGDIARTAALSAGLPESVTGVTVDRQCGSSQQALHFAAAGVASGQYDIAIAGGVESMSRNPMFSSSMGKSPYGTKFKDRYQGDDPNQGIGAEMIAEKWGFSRTELDEFAVRSHELAAAATDAGAFESQIIPVETENGTVSVDEGIRRGGSVEKLAKLQTVFKEDGVIHAGNASQISDGSAAMLVMSSQRAKELGLTPLVRVHTAVLAGADPIMMLTAPIPATEKALKKSGLSINDIGTFEINEAFAPVPLAWLKETGANPDLLNPHGGAIALGHPLGGSGARLMSTMIHNMVNNNIKYGLQSMCEGGGQANATILELL